MLTFLCFGRGFCLKDEFSLWPWTGSGAENLGQKKPESEPYNERKRISLLGRPPLPHSQSVSALRAARVLTGIYCVIYHIPLAQRRYGFAATVWSYCGFCAKPVLHLRRMMRWEFEGGVQQAVGVVSKKPPCRPKPFSALPISEVWTG